MFSMKKLAALCLAAFAADAQAISESGKAAIARSLENAVTRGDTAGVAAAVVGQNGVLWSGSAGNVKVDSIFAIASMTKPVTSVAIMMLAEEGKLKLDDSASKYLAGFEGRPVTIRHLLSHTSGIGYGFSNATVARMMKETKKAEWELPLLNAPGEKWNYGASTRVLGMIVEKLSGESLEAFFQRRIFRPLGMTDTSYLVPEEKQARVAVQTRRVNDTVQEQPRRHAGASAKGPFAGDGGLYSTVDDYGKFLRMLLNGGRAGDMRLLNDASVRDMQKGVITVERQISTDPSLSRDFPLGAGTDKFGLGFQIASAGDPRYRSAGSMSWAGIFNTEFWIDPAKKIAAVHMMQLLPFYDDGAIRALRGFEEAVYRGLK